MLHYGANFSKSLDKLTKGFRTNDIAVLTVPRAILAYPKTWSLNDGFAESSFTSEPSSGEVEARWKNVNSGTVDSKLYHVPCCGISSISVAGVTSVCFMEDGARNIILASPKNMSFYLYLPSDIVLCLGKVRI